MLLQSADVCTVSNDVFAPGDIPDHDVIGRSSHLGSSDS